MAYGMYKRGGDTMKRGTDVVGVCCLIYRYAPIIGGAENQAMLLLPRLAKLGFAPFVVTRRFLREHLPEEITEGYEIYRLRGIGKNVFGHMAYALSALLFLWKRRANFELIHAHGSLGMGIIVKIIGGLLGKEIILTITEDQKIGRAAGKWYGALILSLFKQLPKVVQISEKIHRDLISIGFKRERIAFIPNGVDLGKYCPVGNRSALRLELGVDSEKFVVIFMGRLVRLKGLDVLLRAWNLFLEEFPDSLLIIIGGGSFQLDSIEQEAKEYVARNELGKKVRFVGFQREVEPVENGQACMQ